MNQSGVFIPVGESASDPKTPINPAVLIPVFDHEQAVGQTLDQVLEYDTFKSQDRAFDFRIIDAATDTEGECHTYTNVDITAIRNDLEKRGWKPKEVEEFCASYFSL